LVASRQPSNPIGWIFVAVGLESGVQGVGLGYALNGILGPHAPWPGAAIGAWVNAWLWFPAIMLVTTFVFQLFPNGRLLSPRWRALARTSGVLLAGVSIGLALTPGPLENFRSTKNPFGIDSPVVRIFGGVGFVVVNLLIVLSAATLVIRYRRAGQTEREQIKWIGYAGAVAAAIVPAGDFFSKYKVVDALIILAILFVPVSIGIAVLRYRLYDIDRIISRTVSYAVVTAVLIASYAGLVVLFQAATRPLTGRSDLAVAASTLIVAAFFVPLRRRVQNVVDRRFNRHRYDAARTIEAFTAHLRDEVDISTMADELRDIVGRTMQPAYVSLWLKQN
jgi:asparagine N-glycosylation enzyme membrane subunit Stt3